MKVYLLLVNDEQFFFYSDESEADQSRVEAPARAGWRGWLEGRWHRFQRAWHESDAGVARWARRSWDWLHSMTHPDETMLVRLRSTRRIDLHHPASRSHDAVAEVWRDYLARKWRRHVLHLCGNALVAPLALALLWPLPGPNLIGYWFALSRHPSLADRPRDQRRAEGADPDRVPARAVARHAGSARSHGQGRVTRRSTGKPTGWTSTSSERARRLRAYRGTASERIMNGNAFHAKTQRRPQRRKEEGPLGGMSRMESRPYSFDLWSSLILRETWIFSISMRTQLRSWFSTRPAGDRPVSRLARIVVPEPALAAPDRPRPGLPLDTERPGAAGRSSSPAFTDLFDGRLSRALHGTSTLGQILDPVADKLFVGMVLLTLVLEGELTPDGARAGRLPGPRRAGGLGLVGAAPGLGLVAADAAVDPGQADDGRPVRIPDAGGPGRSTARVCCSRTVEGITMVLSIVAGIDYLGRKSTTTGDHETAELQHP